MNQILNQSCFFFLQPNEASDIKDDVLLAKFNITNLLTFFIFSVVIFFVKMYEI